VAVFASPFLLSFCFALLTAFIAFARADTNRTGALLTTLASFPFWAVALIHAICLTVTSVQDSYYFRLARTLHIRDETRPSRPRLNTNAAPPAYVTERDITSATPTSANYFRHV